MDGSEKYYTTVLLSVFLVLSAGCTSTGTVEPGVDPAVDARSSDNVAIVYGGDLREAVISTGTSGNECGIHTYRVDNLGSSLADGLKKTLQAGYGSVVVKDTLPRNGDFEKVYKFDLSTHSGAIRFDQDPLGGMKATAETFISVKVKVFGGTASNPTTTEQLTGRGQFSKRVYCADGHEVLVVTSEIAIRKVSEHLAEVITSEI